MKKALIIVAVVAGYSLLETALLLSIMLPGYQYPSSVHQRVILCGQLLLIPGMAVLFSRIMHGRHGWRRRAITIFASGIGAPVLAILIALPITLLVLVFSINIVLFVVVLPLVVGLIAAALIFAIRKAGRRSVQLEAARWLAERQSGAAPSECRWRNRGIRWSSWVPSMMVLMVFLFLPETWGMLSHLSQPRAGNLPGYRVPIPVTWIVLDHDDQSAAGESRVMGLAGRGMGLGVRPYLHADLPLSAWDIRSEPATNHFMPRDLDIIGRRVFALGGETVTCLDYWPSYLPPKNIGDSSRAFIQCSGSSRLSASIQGERSHVPTFYKMLEGTAQLK